MQYQLTELCIGPMMEGLVYEWRQYDSDLVPDNYFGPLTKERRARWYDFRERESYLSCESQFLNADEPRRRIHRIPSSEVTIAGQVA